MVIKWATFQNLLCQQPQMFVDVCLDAFISVTRGHGFVNMNCARRSQCRWLLSYVMCACQNYLINEEESSAVLRSAITFYSYVQECKNITNINFSLIKLIIISYLIQWVQYSMNFKRFVNVYTSLKLFICKMFVLDAVNTAALCVYAKMYMC